MKRNTFIIAALISLAFTTTASAHSLWVQTFESRVHTPNHVMSMLGFGHMLPVDDFLFTEGKPIGVSAYFVESPDGERSDLPLPDTTYVPAKPLMKGMTAQGGDLGLTKIVPGDDASEGTYQVITELKQTFCTIYKNKKGRVQLALKSMDSMEKGTNVLRSICFKANGKSMFTVGKWTAPKPSGFDLEIIPETDLSTARAGDLVVFSVLMNGRPLVSSFMGVERLTAHSPSFGGPDKFCLMSLIHNGKAQLRIPAAGQWMIKVQTERDVDKIPALANLKGKAHSVFYSASLAFNAKP